MAIGDNWTAEAVARRESEAAHPYSDEAGRRRALATLKADYAAATAAVNDMIIKGITAANEPLYRMMKRGKEATYQEMCRYQIW